MVQSIKIEYREFLISYLLKELALKQHIPRPEQRHVTE